jgi:hypothetical protein
MNLRSRAGKSSELIVAGELLRQGLDVYLPCVDDQAIDLVIRTQSADGVRYHDVQVKSAKGYNRIIGLRDLQSVSPDFLLVIHYRHELRADEFFYLTLSQIKKHHLGGSWGDLVFNKTERSTYGEQNLSHLANYLQGLSKA